MQVLYYSPTIWSNTDFYRTTGVLPFIKNTEITLRDISHFGKINQWDLQSSDAIIIQRPCNPDHMKLLKLAKKCGLKVIVEYDDAVLHVDMYSPVYQQYKEQKYIILEMIDLADEVWVSTKTIADTFGRGIIIPNALNEYILGNCAEFNSNSNKVVWRGGSAHEADVYEHIEEIKVMVNDNQNLDFFFIGHRFIKLEMALDKLRLRNYYAVDQMPVMQYFDYLKKLKPKAMIFPLCDTVLNRGKSNISLIESAWCGAEYFGNKTLPEFDFPFTHSLSDFPVGSAHKEAVEYVEENLLLSKVNLLREQSLLTL
jgi:hypothetical protein